MKALEAILALVLFPIMFTGLSVWQVPIEMCSDGTTAAVGRFYTLDGWLGAALMVGAVHLLCRLTPLSRWRHVDAALAVATIAVFVAAPFMGEVLAGTLGSLDMNGGRVTAHHVIGWKGALGVVLFGVLMGYRLEVRAAAACVVAGVVLAAGLFVGVPSDTLEDPGPLRVVGHGVCDSDDDAYGF